MGGGSKGREQEGEVGHDVPQVSVTVGVGRGGPELTLHIKPELLSTGHRLEPLCYTVTLGTQCFPPF